MSEEAPETMNLDLNLDPAPETGLGLVSNEGVNSDGLVDSCPFDRVGEPVWGRRCRRIFRIPAETENRYVESDQSMGYLGDLNTLQAGDGSIAADARMTDVLKACENTNEFLEAEVSGTKDDVEKGEVTVKTVIPIYGQGKITHELEEDSGDKIPPRPSAHRVDSWRQIIQRSAFNLPIDEMIRILGRRFHSTRDLIRSQHSNAAWETPERAHSVIDRILMSRRLRREQSTAASHGDVDLMPSSSTGTHVIPSRIHYSFGLERRSQLRRSVSSALTSVSSALNEAEMLVEEYFQSTQVGRNLEQPPAGDDRDSFSSIAAGTSTDTESQTDNMVELSLSASSSRSRRRNDMLRAEVEPPSSRRRLN